MMAMAQQVPVLMMVFASIAMCEAASAQESPRGEQPPLPQRKGQTHERAARETPRFLIGTEGGYGTLQRVGAGVDLFLPTEPWRCEDGLCGGAGIEIQAVAGAGGWRVAGGPVALRYPLWFDALATVTRTREHPLGASPESTYLGGEIGMAFPVWMFRRSVVCIRPSIGVAHRVQGSAESQETILTWRFGAHIVWPQF
jgi:hypothetical protein